jgi:hypothetical protein
MLRRLLVVAVAALAVAPAAAAGTTIGFTPAPTAPTYDSAGHLIGTPFAPVTPKPHLTSKRALDLFLADTKVSDWLSRYPVAGRVTQATFQPDRSSWQVNVWWKSPKKNGPDAGEIATGRVDDATGAVLEAWTGAQVAWKMARGYKGAFGGEKINDPWIWGAFCVAFLIGLVDFRRLFSLRNLDLLAFISFSASLWYFNKGDIFTSVPLVYPPLVYLLVRALVVGLTGRGTRGRPLWPAWVLLAATVFLAGFRVGLNLQASNVIDVGYSGVIGADRIAHGVSPYGHFPIEGTLKACGPADAEGEIRNRIQTNGRCESANPQGDTYGPVAYEAYLPMYAIRGWSGKWDGLPAAHDTTIMFDLLCIIGLFLVGRRFGGMNLGAALAFAWAAYPFTQYASNSNTNDMIMPCFLIWGFWLASSHAGRGALAACAGWTKFAALIVAPLWLTYPDRRPKARFAIAFAMATLLVFVVLLFEPSPLHAARVFWDRTVGWQLNRPAPFSLWDWRQYHARGLPDLHVVQRVLQALLVAAAVVFPFWPARKSPLQLAALTAALLLGFELVLTYWIYLYIPWFFAFSALTTLAPAPAREPRRATIVEPRPELVAAR